MAVPFAQILLLQARDTPASRTTIIRIKALGCLDGRYAPRLGAHFGLLRRLKTRLARGKAGHEIDELVPGPQHDAKRPRHGVAAKRDLPDLVGNVPVAAAAGGKVDHVAGPEAADCALLVGDEGLARDDMEGFVDDVIPGETAGGARPGHDRRGAVGGDRELRRTRPRRAFGA